MPGPLLAQEYFESADAASPWRFASHGLFRRWLCRPGVIIRPSGLHFAITRRRRFRTALGLSRLLLSLHRRVCFAPQSRFFYNAPARDSPHPKILFGLRGLRGRPSSLPHQVKDRELVHRFQDREDLLRLCGRAGVHQLSNNGLGGRDHRRLAIGGGTVDFFAVVMRNSCQALGRPARCSTSYLRAPANRAISVRPCASSNSADWLLDSRLWCRCTNFATSRLSFSPLQR